MRLYACECVPLPHEHAALLVTMMADPQVCGALSRVSAHEAQMPPEGCHDTHMDSLAAETVKGTCRPLDEECDCLTCRQHSRAYLHALARRSLPAGAIAVTFHNVAYMQRLGREIRTAIMEQCFPDYVRTFVRRHHPDGVVPQWIRTGLELAEIELFV